MIYVIFRCPVTGETQDEVLCPACTSEMAPLSSRDTSEADSDIACTMCPKPRATKDGKS